MRFFKSVILLLLLISFCLSVIGCRKINVEDIAVSDTEVSKEMADNQAEKDQSQLENDDQSAKNEQPQAEAEKDHPDQTNQSQPEQTEKESPDEQDAKTEKKYLSLEYTKANLSKEELLAKGHLVVKVRVLSKDSEEMANPDGTAVDSLGVRIDNELVTSYTAEVLDVYKGEYTKQTIVIKTGEGRGLSPDLILHGEDEKHILATPLTRFILEKGKEYVLILVDNKSESKVLTGYFIFGPENGCFSVDEKGFWKNSEPISTVVFEEKNIRTEIASIVSEKKE